MAEDKIGLILLKEVGGFRMPTPRFMQNIRLYCNECKKIYVTYWVKPFENPKNLDNFRNQMKKEGNLILLNPPPVPPYNCPKCRSELEEK